jgi:hypothetical protein
MQHKFMLKLIFVLISFFIASHGIAQTHALAKGWNLEGNDNGAAVDPNAIFGNATISTTVSPSVTTVWVWNKTVGMWNFFAPSMTPAELSTYATTKGYGVLTSISQGQGFWVNANSAVSVNLTAPPVTPGSSCTPPTTLSVSPLAVFQTPAQMTSALAGTWTGCDKYGQGVSITISGSYPPTITGTISKQTNYYATYTNCTYTLSPFYFFPANGEADFNVTTLSCAEGNGKDLVHGDMLNIYTQGGTGTINALMLEFDFVNFAIVTKH